MAKKVIIDIDIQGTGDVIKLQEQIKATKKELKETKDVGTFEQLSKELIRLQSDLKEARKRQREAVDAFTATNEGVGAYSRLSAELRVTRNRLKDLQASGTVAGEEVDQLTARVGELDTQLKNIDRSVGQANREIGQYEEAVRKAVGITDAQTGAFTRLKGRAEVLRKAYRDVAVTQGKTSDEAKKLRKELERVEKQLNQVSNTAQRASGRIGGIRSQLRTLGPAFGALASGFLVFAEIPQAVENLGELAAGFESLVGIISPTVALNADLRQSLRSVTEEFVTEKGELDALFGVAQDDTISREERAAAIDAINERYGEYLPNLLTETSTLEELAAAQELATTKLIENLAQREAQRRLQEDIQALADAEAQLVSLETESQSLFNQIIDFGSRATGAIATFGATEVFGAETSITNARELIAEGQKQIAADGIAQNQELQKRIEKGLTDVNERLKEQGTDLAALGGEAIDELNKEAETAQDKANKRQVEQAKRQAERLRKQQEQARARFLQDEAKQNEKRQALLEKLEADLITAEIKNREESLGKLQAIEQDASNKRIEQLKDQRQRFIDEADAQQQKVNELFGEGSAEALKVQESLATQRLSIEETTNDLIAQERLASTKRLEKIEKDFNKKQADEQKQALEKRLTALQEERQAVAGQVEGELLDIRRRRAQGQIEQQQADTEAFNARIKNLKDQVERINQQEQVLIDVGIDDTSEEFQNLVLERKRLNTELAELEEAQTKKVQEESKKRADATREAFEGALGAFSQSVELVSTFADLANEQNIAQIEQEQAQSEQRLEGLQKELESASGLEAQFLQEEIDREVKAQEELNQKRARAEKEAAIGRKASAIVQAIINTALGVSNALASLPPPVSFITAALTGALGAAQVATIAAQPIAARGGIEGETFAAGGIVVGKSHAQGGEKFAVGGRVVELEGGEAVINKRSTAMFRDKLSAMNVAGGGVKFQSGGITGAPISAPNLGESFKLEDRSQQLTEQNAQLLQATNNRIDRLQVVYTTATDEAIQEDKQDRKEIRQTATL